MATKQVAVRLVAITNQYQAEMARAGRSTQQMAATARASSARASSSIGLIGGAALVGAAAVTDMAMDFETSFARIEGLVGTTGAELETMRQHVLNLAGETAKSPHELADAMYFIASSGLEGQQALDALTASAKAATAGLGDTEVIADAVTSAMNAYAAEGLTAAEATDILTAAVAQGKGEPEELAGSLGKVIPIAAEMGIEFHEVAGALAAMSLAGIDADEGTTALRGMLTGLLSPSKETADALANIGLSADEVRQQLDDDGLLSTLRDLDGRLADNNMGMEDLFPNVRALAGVLNILGGDAEAVNEIFAEVEQSTGDANAAFEVMADTAEFKTKSAIEELKASAIDFGSEMADALGMAAQGFSDFNSAVESAVGASFSDVVSDVVSDSIGDLLTGRPKFNDAVADFWRGAPGEIDGMIFDPFGGGGSDFIGGIKAADEAMINYARDTNSMVDAQLAAIAAQEAAVVAVESADRALVNVSGSLADVTIRHVENATAVQSADTAMINYARDTNSMVDAQEAAAKAAEEHEQALADLFDEVDRNLSTMFDYENALHDLVNSTQDYEQRERDLNTQLGNNEITLEEYATELRNLRVDQNNLADDALSAAEMFAEQQGAVAGSTESYKLQKEELLRLADQFPLLRDEIARYIEELNRIPSVIGTQITIGFSGGGSQVVRSSGDSQSVGDVGRTGRIAFDSGGVVPGPRGAPVPILAHAGETILPTHKPMPAFPGASTLSVTFDIGNLSTSARDGQELIDDLMQAGRRQGVGQLRRMLGIDP